ncbi:zinc-binding protein [Pseudomonas alcaligenes]|uniref:Zinc-binding protein n=1 Tax=Aquipseudomonas alcaligenes TaxID=43263 RepID=A0ABR7S460_AQUAC|nr:DUF2796 domain-containing protein [Pseudomonas alcaligenes]MBC9252355.1 zinc-binding protein [Pseudomonas alcaligenes]
MRRTLLALSIALLPLAAAQASEEEHGSLGKHEHGVATLDVALDGQTLELQLESPAMNIVGFEHAASSAADQAKAASAKAQLQQALELFGLPAAAGCSIASLELHSPLFGDAAHDHDHDHDHDQSAGEHAHEHSDVDAAYRLTCSQPQQLNGLDLGLFFQRFPATEKLQVQLIGPNGQQGAELSPGNPRLNF